MTVLEQPAVAVQPRVAFQGEHGASNEGAVDAWWGGGALPVPMRECAGDAAPAVGAPAVGAPAIRADAASARSFDAPTVGIVGLGLIGGSLAQGLLARGVRVLGVTRDWRDAALAARAGVTVLDDLDALAANMPGDGMIVLATPLSALATVGDALVARLPAETVVLHAAGLQRAAATALGTVAQARVLGTHPLAGSHETGFAAARGDLFAGATVWAESRADGVTRTRVEWLWRAVGVGAFTYATAEAHDTHMAWVSHLPQLASVALAGALAESGVTPEQGGPGLRDTTRLAASPFPLWRDLLAAAPSATSAALRALAVSIERLEDAFTRGDERALAALWERAHDWRCAPILDAHRTAEEDAVLDSPTAGMGGRRW